MDKTNRHQEEDKFETWNHNQSLPCLNSNLKKFIPIFHNEISDAVREVAERELNETAENIQEGLTNLKHYLKKEKLPSLDDRFLLAILRVSKFQGKKAEQKLKQYCHMRIKKAEDFEKLDLKTVRNVISKNMVGFLPFRDEGGRAIVFSRWNEWYSEVCELEDVISIGYLLVLYNILLPITSICGVRYLCDLKARSYELYYQYYKGFKNNLSTMLSVPVRINVDCIHDNALCRGLYILIRPFLPTKIVKRLRLHGYNYESLHKEIDISILPEEYGGSLGPLNSEFLMENFEEFFHKFKAENAMFLVLSREE